MRSLRIRMYTGGPSSLIHNWVPFVLRDASIGKMGPLSSLIDSSKRLRPETRRLYLSAVRGFEEFCGPNLAQATGETVERWRDAMVATGVTPETINVRLFALRFATRRLADLGRGVDFARAAELLPSAPQKKELNLTTEGAKKLVSACAGEEPADIRDRAIIVLALRTGLRRGGIAGIDLADLAGSKLVVTLKGGTKHTPPALDAETLDALVAWRTWLVKNAKVTEGKLFRSIRAQRDLHGQWVVGSSMNGQAIYRAIRGRGAQVGLNLGAHTCRHWFVSNARHLGWPDWQIALFTGHRSVAGLHASFPMLDVYTSALGSAQRAQLPALTLSG